METKDFITLGFSGLALAVSLVTLIWQFVLHRKKLSVFVTGGKGFYFGQYGVNGSPTGRPLRIIFAIIDVANGASRTNCLTEVEAEWDNRYPFQKFVDNKRRYRLIPFDGREILIRQEDGSYLRRTYEPDDQVRLPIPLMEGACQRLCFRFNGTTDDYEGEKLGILLRVKDSFGNWVVTRIEVKRTHCPL